jgi:hypothetical protein
MTPVTQNLESGCAMPQGMASFWRVPFLERGMDEWCKEPCDLDRRFLLLFMVLLGCLIEGLLYSGIGSHSNYSCHPH